MLSAASVLAGASIQDMITVRQAKGAGYAMSRTQELVYMQQVAQDTGKRHMQCTAVTFLSLGSSEGRAGIVLDPVYSGKALFCFAQEVRENPAAWEGRKVLFLHTGEHNARQVCMVGCASTHKAHGARRRAVGHVRQVLTAAACGGGPGTCTSLASQLGCICAAPGWADEVFAGQR